MTESKSAVAWGLAGQGEVTEGREETLGVMDRATDGGDGFTGAYMSKLTKLNPLTM